MTLIPPGVYAEGVRFKQSRIKSKWRKMMTSKEKKRARIVGILFITATVASSLAFAILDPILNAPDFLVNVSANATQVIIGVLFLLVDSAAVVGIAVMMFPILKKYNEALALGYVGFRVIEAAIIIVASIILLSLLTLSQEYVQAAATDASYFQTLGTFILAVWDWTLLLGIMIVFSLTALILNYLLYQTELVPRWLSVWGLIGATLLLATGLLEMFGINLTDILSLPIALQEMVFAIWLIVKGLNSSASAFEAAKTDMSEV
jgi:hypothetical protein